eukprot:CAMPEP_0119281328 /NCGR_PEP_ID=MMETSP1329-20130426/24520_1 /TAXON_ID=114041 /ORGANISM="Genus nov. species nov., Strain RCC1024" /LENGTH=49 /DNA_ID= /DNA_START= /DNA_END= /DNA_ORIENTATION=
MRQFVEGRSEYFASSRTSRDAAGIEFHADPDRAGSGASPPSCSTSRQLS